MTDRPASPDTAPNAPPDDRPGGGQRECVLALPVEAQAEASDTAQQHPRFERTQDRPGEQPLPFDGVHQIGLTSGDVSGDQITVAGQGPLVPLAHQIRTQRQRKLTQRRGRGVVDHQLCAASVADTGESVQIHYVQRRVRRRFSEHQVSGLGGLTHLRGTRPITVIPSGARLSAA